MALDKFQPYLFVSAGEQSNKYITPVISPDGIASFQAQRAQDLSGLTIRIDPIQEGTGDPSPTNIRPISGRTGMTVTAANKNLAPNYAGTASTTSNGITFTYNDDGSITLNGTATASAYSRAVDGIAGNIRRPYGTYKKPVAAFGNHYVGLFVQYQKSTSSWNTVTGGGVASDTFTLDEDYPLAIRIGVTAGTTVDNYRFEPYIYLDSVNDLTWVSPTKTDIPITWESIAGTVYGGTLDVVSGVLTVDKVFRQCDADSNFGKSSSTSVDEFYLRNSSDDETGISGAPYGAENIICSHAASLLALSTTEVCTLLGGGGQARICFPLSMNINTLALFKTWLGEQATAGTPLQFCYKLATPQNYQLTPTEIKTLAGFNQIYSDAGPVIDIKF